MASANAAAASRRQVSIGSRFNPSTQADIKGLFHVAQRTTATLLSNLYLNEVDRMLEQAKEHTRSGELTGIEYVRFADDGAPRRRGGRLKYG
jgi:hypothetical protein